METITYHEVEELLRTYPMLRSLLKSTQASLQAVYLHGTMESEDDVIYALAIGNKRLDGLPITGAGGHSDKTSVVAGAYKNAITNTHRGVTRAMAKEIIDLGLVIEKIQVAMECLPPVQREIIEMIYWQRKTWAEVLNIIHMGERQAKRERTEGVSTIYAVIRIEPSTYARIMDILITKQ